MYVYRVDDTLVWQLALPSILVRVNCSVVGSKISAGVGAAVPAPANSTRPSKSFTAACAYRATFIECRVGRHVPVAGFNSGLVTAISVAYFPLRLCYFALRFARDS